MKEQRNAPGSHHTSVIKMTSKHRVVNLVVLFYGIDGNGWKSTPPWPVRLDAVAASSRGDAADHYWDSWHYIAKHSLVFVPVCTPPRRICNRHIGLVGRQQLTMVLHQPFPMTQMEYLRPLWGYKQVQSINFLRVVEHCWIRISYFFRFSINLAATICCIISLFLYL